MRSFEPDKYPYSDEHYRIDFKDSKREYPCVLDNLIVHEGFSINYEWYLNEAVEWKWRSLKPEQKQKKKNVTNRKQTVKKQIKKPQLSPTRRNKQDKTKKP